MQWSLESYTVKIEHHKQARVGVQSSPTFGLVLGNTNEHMLLETNFRGHEEAMELLWWELDVLVVLICLHLNIA